MDNLPLDVISTIKLGFNLYIDHLSNCDFSAVLVTFVAFILLLSNFKLFDSTFKRSLYTCIRNAPFIRTYIKNKIDKASKEIHRDIHEKTSHVVYEKKLPICGQTAENVLSDARKYKMLGLFLIYKEFLWTNPVHPELFVDIRRMEAEVIRMCVTMFHGDKDACGTTTSGGTESILLACLAYRQLARERVHVPLDPVTYKVDMIEMKSSITRDTCMLGQKYNIPVHVDCCLGGFLLPFMEKVNYPIEEFDFRLPGYGFAPKGTSIIMYRDQYYRSRQYFTQTTWPGGLYASSTLPGSRPGALIATCWAALMYHGESGYCKSTKRIISTTRYITDELRKIPGINILGQPNVSIVAFGSNNFNIYKLGHALLDKPNGRGWNLNNLQFPPAIHFCVTDMHTVKGCADKFIHDVKEAVKELRKTPNTKPEGSAALYGLSHMIPDRSIVEELAHCYLDAYYDTPSND
ncbi:Sphingosine-1-phosphate lyase 1 [Schistosoma japonicum]|nr:Sphingosine-1-phosphate lyase 1 [Schistosoma japonicum]